MPPVRANGNGPPGGAPNPGNGQSQLNPAQLAQLHEYIRQKRQANGGGDITAAMVTDWMRANQLGPGVGLGGAGAGAAGFPPQLNQQLDPSQQQQLLIAQRQHMLQQQQAQQQAQQAQQQQHLHQPPPPPNHLIAHLFPPHLANNQNPAGALQHLQAVLFPPQNLGQPPAQNPLLSQVLTLAQAQRLSPEQMQLLRTAVASRNPPQPPPQQSHPQNTGQQYTAQQQAAMQAHQQQVMAAQAAQAASAHQNQALPPSLPPQQQHQGQQPSTAGSEAQHLVVTLQHRVASIENLLKRPDLQGDHRQKAQAELKASQAQLQQVVKGFLAQHPQAPGAAADLQQAQRVAMAQREAEIQRQRSQQSHQQQQLAQQQQQQQLQQNNSAYRSPAQFPPQTLPPQHHPHNRTASPALSAPSPADAAKALLLSQSSKKGASQGGPMSQQQAALVAQQQSSLASSQAQALAQAQAQAMVHSKTHAQQSPLHHPPPSSQPTLPTPIPSSLSMPPASPESFPAPRPTLNSGLANAPAVSTPAITKHPGFAPQTIADTLGFGTRKKEEGGGGGGKAKDVRGDEGSKGRIGQKRKIRELVEQVDPEEVLDPEVEDLLLDIADEFIDSMTRFACQLAKHRKSDRLEVKDLALHLDRSYNMKVPGFGPEETRSSQTRRINLPPGYQGRLAAVREASARGR